jgi:hypothetical protein
MQGKEGIDFCFLSSLAWVKVLEKNEKGWRSEINIGLLL